MTPHDGDRTRGGVLRRALALRALAALLVLYAAVGLWSAATADQRSAQDRVDEVVSGLRCPTCAGETVADSAAPMAEAMRVAAAERVAEGRSAAQVREWFAQRYGDEVLLDPPRRGTGWLLWSLPLVLVVTTVATVAIRRSRAGRWVSAAVAVGSAAVLLGAWTLTQRDQVVPEAADGEQQQRDAGSLAVLHEAVRQDPAALPLRLALAGALEEQGSTAGAVEQYAAAVRLAPLDPDVRYRYAFALLREGSAPQSVEVLQDSLQADPEHPPSLLLLGTLLREEGDGRGDQLLRRFLEVAPDHPAAGTVEPLLEDRP